METGSKSLASKRLDHLSDEELIRAFAGAANALREAIKLLATHREGDTESSVKNG